jgi:hypothetical protein
MPSDGVFTIPGIPRNEQEARAAAMARGWSKEEVHGKPLDICPNCKLKT